MKQTPRSEPMDVRPIVEDDKVVFAGGHVEMGEVIDVPDEMIVDPESGDRAPCPRVLAGFTPVDEKPAPKPAPKVDVPPVVAPKVDVPPVVAPKVDVDPS